MLYNRCDDGSGTGSGFCMEGNSTGSRIDKINDRYNNPNKHLTDVTNRLMNLDSTFLNKDDVNIFDLYSVNNKQGHKLSPQSKQICKADKWYYTECPICQCNGHSQCRQGTSICNKPCQHDTEGEHCEDCKSGRIICDRAFF